MLTMRLARLLMVVAIPVTGVAVGLGRYGPRPLDQRRMAPTRHRPVTQFLFPQRSPGAYLLDIETGAIDRVALAEAGRLQYSACSPWRDGQGRTHLVGLLRGASSTAEEATLGLIRYALPGGEILDRVELDVLPGSAPCWFPDGSERLLFAGWDGRLYRVSFEPPGGAGSKSGDPRAPCPVRWRGGPPGGCLMIGDPTWPSDPRLGGKILASLIMPPRPGQEPSREGPPRCTRELWWLQLDADGSAVEAAGRLVSPGVLGPGALVEERLPTVSAGPDGGLVLAYLGHREGDYNYRLRLAPLALDDPSGAPRVAVEEAVELSEESVLSPPAFSADGRWLFYLTRAQAMPARAERASVIDALAGPRDGGRQIARRPGAAGVASYPL